MIILITGGASGLGEAITRTLATEQDNKIYFTYSSSKTAADVILSQCTNTTAIKCDFKNNEDIEALKDQITVMNPDVLINNAYFGTFIKSYFHKSEIDDFLNDFKNNLIPTIAITQQAINLFRKRKSGKIITILTSALVNLPPTGAAIYTANKAYLSQLSKVWAAENGKYNITSNTVSPSLMLTGFTKDLDERVVEQIKDNHPLKKILTTQEVAEAVLFLTKASHQINGIDILINSASNIKN